MDFSSPNFAEPRWLWLAVLAPLALVVLLAWSARARRRQLSGLASSDAIGQLTRSHSTTRRWLKHALVVLAVIAMSLALARPQWGETEQSGQLLGEDVIFVLDCSQSMLATDVAPNRLERARLSILDFVQRHARGRVGLVAFAGQAFIQCPLTFDYGAFEDTLRIVDTNTIPIPGSDLGRALDEASHAIEKTDRRKLIVVLTDGEDLEEGGIKAAERLAKEGVVIFTVGVGTRAGSEIKVKNAQGQMDFLRDAGGRVVRSRLDEVTLRRIAEATRGRYEPLGPLGEGLARVRSALETLDLDGVAAPSNRLGVDRFHVPVAIALVLLAAEAIIGTRRRFVR